MIATIHGPRRRDFWSAIPVSMYSGAPFRFKCKMMTRNRFEYILSSNVCTNEAKTNYIDRFVQVHQMLKAWNKNMGNVFDPSWISCLDENMSFWRNKYTCPGFICGPRKPWPFGNEYHTIYYGESGILFGLELIEGKDHPKDMGKPIYEEKGGATFGLLLRLTKQIWGTGKVIVLDSGFCVL